MRFCRHTVLALMLLLLTSCGIQRFSQRSVLPPRDTSLYASILPAYRPLSALLTEDTGLPPREGNDIRLFPDGEERLRSTLQDWNGARLSLCLEKYRLQRGGLMDTLFCLMETKARSGVDVRLLVERHAQLPIDRVNYRKLRRSGVDVAEYHPLGHFASNLINLNRRDHRKIEIIDGGVAYVGGRNISDRNFLRWKDLDIRVSGPLVQDIMTVFMKNWVKAGGRDDPVQTLEPPVLPEGKTAQVLFDGPKDRRWTIRDLHEWTLANTQTYFYCSTPYFSPPLSTIKALCDAARRGVDVRILLPEDCDLPFMNRVAESYFRQLLSSGVRIWMCPGMHHAKRFFADDYLSSVGSANLDQRSFFTNYEDDVIIYDAETASEGRRIFLEELAQSHEVTSETMKGWSVFRRLAGGFLRIFARQL